MEQQTTRRMPDHPVIDPDLRDVGDPAEARDLNPRVRRFYFFGKDGGIEPGPSSSSADRAESARLIGG